MRVLTERRRLILERLRSAPSPITVAAIHALLGNSMDLATVYRGVQALEKAGYVEGLTLPCSQEGTRRYYVARDPGGHSHFFHCQSCHSFFNLGACGLERLQADFEKHSGATVLGHVLYFVGLCASCAKEGTRESERAALD